VTRWNACRELHDEDESEATEELEDEHATQHSTQGSFETQLGRRGFLCLCGAPCSMVGTDSERGEAECMGHMTHHIATRNPLSPQPRDSHVLLTAIQRRLELLESAGFWVDRWLKPSRPVGL